MIPKNITKEHILAAIKKIDNHEIPEARKSTKFLLVHEGQEYPPKYVISIAHKLANRRELLPSEFSGGKESNDFLRNLGFKIINREQSGQTIEPDKTSDTTDSKPKPLIANVPKPVSDPSPKPEPLPLERTPGHSQRCSECKNTIIEMLWRLFGEVKIEHKFDIDFPGEESHKQPFLTQLMTIKGALESFRHFTDFAKAKKLPRCDVYVPDPGFILEMDESQHFSQARKVSLLNYPKEFKVGYDLQEWMNYCDQINASDTDPPHRDEQRAWYDTLRDFIPTVMNLKPTVRIRMGSHPWCLLDPVKEEDRKKFVDLIPGLPSPGPIREKIEETQAGELRIATVCIESWGEITLENWMQLLQKVLNEFGQQVDVFIFPAGFFNIEEGFEKYSERMREELADALQKANTSAILCIGVDANQQQDQLALAVNRNGLIAMAKKFYPTVDEADFINLASDPFSGENGLPRVFSLKGRKIFLAICYDSFGIRKHALKNTDISVIVNLVHGFTPKGEPGCGDVFFARHGFAGSSRQWRCPTFAAAVFWERSVPEKWPTGVMWSLGAKTTKDWKYSDNAIDQPDGITVTASNPNDKAVVRIFSLK